MPSLPLPLRPAGAARGRLIRSIDLGYRVVSVALAPRCIAAALALFLAATAACSKPAENAPPPTTSPAAEPPAPASGEPAATAATNSNTPRIVFLGDSLTAGLGLSASEAYPAVVGELLKQSGRDFEIVNAGVSGDTSAGGLRRLDWSLQGHVRVLVVALGGNDGLRGLPVEELRRNLATIIARAQSRGIQVVLAGMEAPPNFGDVYTRRFRDVYADLARAYHVQFIPFFLADVAGRPALNQPDGIHPTAEGQRLIAARMLKAITPLLDEPSTR
jgi:acyl-CoA thioesterase-1